MSGLRVGTSGWQYQHWKGRFYPKDLPTAKWLDYYTRYFDTVELNNPLLPPAREEDVREVAAVRP